MKKTQNPNFLFIFKPLFKIFDSKNEFRIKNLNPQFVTLIFQKIHRRADALLLWGFEGFVPFDVPCRVFFDIFIFRQSTFSCLQIGSILKKNGAFSKCKNPLLEHFEKNICTSV